MSAASLLLLSLPDAEARAPALHRLADGPLESNVFFAPAFLLPAMRGVPDRRGLRLMALEGVDGALRFAMPFSVERPGLGPRAVRAWVHPFAPLGTPLVAAAVPAKTFAALFRTLAERRHGLPRLLVLPDVRRDGPLLAALEQAAARIGLPLRTTLTGERAALAGGSGEGGSPWPAKRRRELARGRRLLEARGTVAFETAREPATVAAALEEFFRVEAGGWKGRAGSALASEPRRLAFAQGAVNGLAASGRARVHTLRFDGEAVAGVVVLVDGGEAYAWKMAFDERFAALGVGVQAMALASEALRAEPGFSRADSCAVGDHALMNGLWRDRLATATAVVGLAPDARRAVDRAVRAIEREARLRAAVRQLRARLKAALKRG